MTPSPTTLKWNMVALATSLAISVHAHDWPEFRGPTGQGLSPAHNVPSRWSPTENVAWKIALPGAGWSSPVLVQNRLYVTTAVAQQGSKALSLQALCIDAHNGKIIWNSEVFHPDDGASLHTKNSYASPTPIVRNGRLYVHFGHLGTACLDLNGKIVWKQSSIQYPPVHGNGGSPVLTSDKLIFNCDGLTNPMVVALDAHTGKVQWKAPRNNDAVPKKFAFSTPLVIEVNGHSELISPGAGGTYAYNPSNGKPLWKVSTGNGFSVVPRPVYAHGLLFVNSDYDFPKLLAIRPGGHGDVTTTHVAWQTGRGAPSTPSTLVVDSEIFFVSDKGIATCADAKTGEVHWNERLGGGFSASPIHAEGKVYFQNEEGVGYVVKASKSFELLAKNDLAERTLASYAVDDHTLFIRTAQHLYRIGKQ